MLDLRPLEFDSDEPWEIPEYEWPKVDLANPEADAQIDAWIERCDTYKKRIIDSLSIAERSLYYEYLETGNISVIEIYKMLQAVLAKYCEQHSIDYVTLSDPRDEPTFTRK